MQNIEIEAAKCGQRVGQWFVNRYVKQPWPELYYCENSQKAKAMILAWMQQHCYTSIHEIPRVYK